MGKTRRLGGALAWALGASPCLAATITVDIGGGSDHTSIQPAIDAAQDGDTVLVKPGEYVITVAIMFRGKAITVKGEDGPRETTIRMSETSEARGRSVVIFERGDNDTALLEGFTITGALGRPRASRTWAVDVRRVPPRNSKAAACIARRAPRLR